LAAVAAKYPAFRELNAEVLTVSVDSVATHKDWQEKELDRMIQGGVRFPMLSDPGGVIGKRYSVYDGDAKTDQRGRFILDPSGVVQSMEITCDSLGRNVTEVLRQLRALRHRQETDELMPCGWEPGKPTLPGQDEASHLSGEVWKTWKPSNAF
jgi:alkyl hydroperoxide reductase subunit AhpC